MKKDYKGWFGRVSVGLALILGASAGQAATTAASERVIPSPVAPREISATTGYSLGTITASLGLWTVGVGETVHLEAQVLQETSGGTSVVVTADADWAVTAWPVESTVHVIGASLLGAMPIYNPMYRDTRQIAGRASFVPDVVGTYTITGTIHTDVGGANVVTVTVVCAAYAGVGDPASDALTPQCATCHELDKLEGWQGTLHATKLEREIQGLDANWEPYDSHYSTTCVSCHAVGYDKNAPNNGGFYNVMLDLGLSESSPAWFTTLQASNWTGMNTAMKELANIQCENCHGAGASHTGNAAKISVSYDVGVCAKCHDSGSRHVRPAEWGLSRHANQVLETSSSCTRCHTGSGFINFVTPRMHGATPLGRRTGMAENIGCAACHDPHSNANERQVRSTQDAALFNGDTVTDGGLGKLCMQCHVSRRDAETYVLANHSHYGPHGSPQTDMLAGVNAAEFGQYIASSSGHLLSTENACVTCHMQTLEAGNPALPSSGALNGVSQAGAHTLRMVYDNLTPDNPDDDVDQAGVCSECHGEQEDFNIATRKDFDGDGIVEGVEDEIESLMEQLAILLPPVGEATVADPTSSYTLAQLSAVYNYRFVENDGSNGVHNPQYAAGILKASITALQAQDAVDGRLGGTSEGGGWVLSSWLGYYSPIFDGNWIFHQYHGPLYVAPGSTSDDCVLYDPVLDQWLYTNSTMYPNLEFSGTGITRTFTRSGSTRVFTNVANSSDIVNATGFSFTPPNITPTP